MHRNRPNNDIQKPLKLNIKILPVADPGFPAGGAPTPGDANILFDQFFPQTAWKWGNLAQKGPPTITFKKVTK